MRRDEIGGVAEWLKAQKRARARLPVKGVRRDEIGGVAEWLKAHAWKACLRETVTWVRIPLPPPPSRGERLSVADLGRENALNLQHSETDVCTLDRGPQLNRFS